MPTTALVHTTEDAQPTEITTLTTAKPSASDVSLCRVNLLAAWDSLSQLVGCVGARSSLLMGFPTCSAHFPAGCWKLHLLRYRTLQPGALQALGLTEHPATL